MGDVTPNFSRHEMTLSRAAAGAYGFAEAPYPEEWIEDRLKPLFRVLEKIRSKCGGRRVIIIEGGGYRPPEYDAERIRRGVPGVSPDSQHGHGRAADIRIEGLTPEQVHAAILELYTVGEIAIGGLGLYDHFVHVDIKLGPLRQWDRRRSK